MKDRKTSIPMISVVFFMIVGGYLGVDIHLASMPAIQVFMHTDPRHMQQSVSFFLVGMGISLLFYGPLSDRFGRKPVVIVGLAVACLSSFATLFVDHIGEFLLVRTIQGMGSAVCAGIGRTILADTIQGKRLAAMLSYAGMAVCVSPLMAPMIGGYLEHWFHWRANFLALGCYMLVALLLVIYFVPETNQYKNPRALSFCHLAENYRYLLSHRVFLGASLLSGMGLAATMCYAATSSFILQRGYHISPVEYGWLTSLVSLGSLIGRIVSVRLINYWGRMKSVRLAQFLFVFAGSWLLVIVGLIWHTIPMFMIGVFMVTFAQAMTQGNCSSLALSPFKQQRGMASALYGGTQSLVAFAYSAVVAASVHDIDLLGVAYLIIGCLGVVAYYQLMQPKAIRI